MNRIHFFALLALGLAACGGESGQAAPPQDPPAASPPAPQAAHGWRSNPAEGVQVAASDTAVTVETGPHAVLWEEGGAELAPPYTVRASLRKVHGRLHEGFGLVFGATGLDASEAEQAYSYFLVRGDGSFLIKRRQGAETPVVRDWTRHPAIPRDADDGNLANELEVAVGTDEVVFRVGGEEVARVPAAELSVRGRAGVRASHDVRLEVAGFRAAPDAQ